MPKVDNLFNYNRSPKRLQPSNISGVIDQGWYVSPDYPDKSGFYNALLGFQEPGADGQTSQVGLFVNKFDFSMGLSGNTAQSHQINQFYPQSINTPELMVTCQARSQFEYSYIAEFIRTTQVWLTTNYHPGANYHGLVHFYLDSFVHDEEAKNNWGKHGSKNSLAVTIENPNPQEITDDRNTIAVAASGNHMGGRRQIDLKCYITSVSRLAEVGQNAYEFQFGLQFYDTADWSGLPFSSLVQGVHDSADGVQWTYEEIDLHKTDKTFVGPSDIKITMPHQGKNGKATPTPPKAPPKTTPSPHATLGFGGDVFGSLINALGSLSSALP